MENVTLSEVNTDDEKCKLFNRIIDEINRLEGKVLQTIADNRSSVDLYNKDVEKYNEDLLKKGGK